MAFKWLGLCLLVLCLVDNLHAHFDYGLRERCSTGLRSGVCKPESDCPYHKRIDELFHHPLCSGSGRSMWHGETQVCCERGLLDGFYY